MSNHPVELQHPAIELESETFQCPTCGADIATANQLTHEVACARMHRNGNQRAPAAQPMVRHSSSSAIPEVDEAQIRPQSGPKREERRVIENRMVACPNCGKSVREQEVNSHMDSECLKNELIPCEFCDESIPMSDYSQHVDSCPRRSQNRPNNNRDQSPIRQRAEPDRQVQDESDDVPQEEEEHEQPQNERDRSPQREASQGGIRGWLRNIASSAADQLRAYNEHLQQEAQQRQQAREEQERRQQEMLRHMFGQPQRQPARDTEDRRQQEMLEHMFGQPQVPRNPFSSQNALVPHSGSRVVRTVERGPGGSVIVRSRVVPSDQLSGMPGMPGHSMEMNGVNPLEMLIGMMSGRMGGMQGLGHGENMQAPEPEGLSKDTIDSLALVKYSKEANKNVDEESKKCPICLDQFEEGQEVRFLWCTHRFHRGCVDQWLDKHTSCPICKKEFSEAEAEQGFAE